MKELAKRIDLAIEAAKGIAEDCLNMFGLSLEDTDYGEFVENEDKTYCGYDRCNAVRRYECSPVLGRCRRVAE